MSALLRLAFPPRLHHRVTSMATLIFAWVLTLLIFVLSVVYLGRPYTETAWRAHPSSWNSLNNILEKVISENSAHWDSHAPIASGPQYRASRDTVHEINKFQNSLDIIEGQLWTFRHSNGILGASDTRRNLSSLHTSTNTSALAAEFCSTLSARKLLFVGSENTFYLHSLWLKTLEKYEGRQYYCHDPNLCTFHHICQSLSNATEPFQVMDSLRLKKRPTEKEFLSWGSSVIRYSHSDSLHMSDNEEDMAYTKPMVDIFSHVRVRNAYYLGHLKRADVILMGRAPLPAPAWSYANSGSGFNWAYRNHTYRNQSWPYLEGNSLTTHIIQAALHNTLVSFLPTTIHSLNNLQMTLGTRHKILVWHSSWYRYPQCSSIRSSKNELYVEDLSGPLPHIPVRRTDPWSLYHNTQVYIQNRLMRALLPRYGIAFLPMVPGNKDHTLGRNCQKGKGSGNILEIHFLKAFIALVKYMLSPERSP
ncbi:hypothetical protein BDZ94DRAFT_885328 [Collybia nuda]|uniref:Uncharacterized protein n=1 Tax=Collybia nuda TaxID=64659 RepID=A0A9P5Y3R4_9AGAR|nr:hypothetical protein BDZ94DRAFT_885328 [Collybia nuda]